jgi:carbamoyltransferase
LKKILGISAYFHDSAAAIIIGGKVMAAAQEERFTREKHTAEFPTNAVRFCLKESGLKIDDLDALVFYDKPLLKFERILESDYANAPKGLFSFLKSTPDWIGRKLFLRKELKRKLSEIERFDKRKLNMLFTEHHLSHAASAFYPSGFDSAAILTIDGVGEWSTASIAVGEGKKIKFLREMAFPHSVGLLYSAFTYYLGFKVNSGEYKLMGLAPFGQHDGEQVASFVEKIKSAIVTIHEDGSIFLDQSYFNYLGGLRMARDEKWDALFGIKRRLPEETLKQEHCDLALAIQFVTEEIVLKMAETAKKITGQTKLCMAGGVALNCVANGKLLDSNLFEDLFIQPASGDAGGAVGAALAVSAMYFDEQPKVNRDPYLGPSYDDRSLQELFNRFKAKAECFSEKELVEVTAQYLSEGSVVGWFQGKMEFGPRALGNRSILADPSRPEMQYKVNMKIKERESFRPFAPSVLEEDAKEYFDLKTPSPYMLLVAGVNEKLRKKTDDIELWNLPLTERLKEPRSDLQAVTHMDYSARIQTVNPNQNKRFYDLLHAFKKVTGKSVLLNTSFNVRGEPIVCTPLDAYRCFMATDMDVLVINDYVFLKTQQPGDKSQWRVNFKAD